MSSSCAEVEGGSVVHASERVGCIWPQGLGMSTDQQELSKRSHQEQQPKPAASCLGAHITRAAQRSHVRCTSTCVPCIGSCQSSLLSGAPQRRPSAAPLPSGSAPLSQGGYSGKPATCPTHRWARSTPHTLRRLSGSSGSNGPGTRNSLGAPPPPGRCARRSAELPILRRGPLSL